MKSVLAILGIAIGAIFLGVLISPKRPDTLTPNPQDKATEQQMKSQEEANKQAKSEVAAEFKPPIEGAFRAVLSVKGRGDVTIEFYPKAAPGTVARIQELIKSGYYDGILVHRVEPGFVVQAGDPKTKTGGVDADGVGTGGSGQSIKYEASKLPHVEGSVAMALSSPRSDTADSQWFINLSNNSPLNGDYCVFGKVVEGMDVVKKVAKGDAITSFKLK